MEKRDSIGWGARRWTQEGQTRVVVSLYVIFAYSCG